MQTTCKVVCLLVLILCGTQANSQTHTLSLIPEPESVERMAGKFRLTAKTVIQYKDHNAKVTAEMLNEFLLTNYGFKLKITPEKATEDKIVIGTDRQLTYEAYRLKITSGGMTLDGHGSGLFYGLQTLEQLAPQKKGAELEFPTLIIKDKPRFEYRGLMLDVSRHFYSIAYVKKFLQVMAHFKFNRFHWHLTNDQGWRIEIKKYPKLQSVSAWREPVDNIKNSEFTKAGKYGGYYTQEEIKEVVAYAASLHITVIPEIEMPGHTTAVLAAYPELGCTGGPYQVLSRPMISKEVFCAGNEQVFQFLEDVLSEVMILFPSEYIHIGGDETPKDRWHQCDKCQSRIKTNGLKDEYELQSYFIHRIEKFVNSKGKKIIGWDEILEGGLAPNATVMSWRGEAGGIAASRLHHDVIMSPYTYLYFDYYQGNEAQEPSAFPGSYLPLSTVYNYEPMSDSLSVDEQKYIKGVQGNVWGENIATGPYADYMTYPRALALAEIAWSPAAKKDYTRFLEKLKSRLVDLEKKAVPFRIPEPIGLKDIMTVKDKVQVHMSPSVDRAEVFYTTNGNTPNKADMKYTKPFNLKLSKNKPLLIKTLTVLPSGRESLIYSAEFIKKDYKMPIKVKPAKPGLMVNITTDKIGLARDIKINKPDFTAIVADFTVAPFAKVLRFGAIYEGYFLADMDGIYTFRVNSDDGALLYLDAELILENDGFHAASEKSGALPLKKGYHSIKLYYFDGGGGRKLEVKVDKDEVAYDLKKRLFHE